MYLIFCYAISMDILPLSEAPSLPTTQEEASTFAESIIQYFSRPQEIMEEEVFTTRSGKEETRLVSRVRPAPLLEEWCVFNRISKRQLLSLAEAFPVIAHAIEFSRDVLKVYLIRGGLSEQYNGQFAKFVATNETDMVDRSEQVNKNLNVSPRDLLDEIEASSKPLRRST